MKRIGLIGRTNVGKSTLFNRIIKEERSITSDIAGTTRDFIVRQITIGDDDFELLDFGGFDFDSKGIMDIEIQKNIIENLSKLDLVLFVVDGKCSISNEDEKIAEIIRRSKKKTILVVNKVDGKKQEDELYDFFSFGFDDVIGLSAINSKNIEELILLISERLNIKKTRKRIMPKREFTRIAIIGKPNVGKSSLFNVICGEDRSIVTDVAGTTRDSVDIEVAVGKEKYTFLDTAGLRRKTKISDFLDRESSYKSIKAINSAQLVMYVVDVNNYVTDYDIKLINYAWRKGKAIIMVVNKWDIKPSDMTENKFKNILIADASIFKLLPFVFVSAIKNKGIEKLFSEIENINNKMNFEIKTSVLNKEIQGIILGLNGIDKKFYYATQVGKNPMEILMFINKKKFFNPKQIEFIEKKIREDFELYGFPIFLKLREKEKRI